MTTAAELDDIRRTSALLFEAVAAAQRDFAAAAAEHGLTPLLARAVLTLEEPRPMRDVAERLGCDASLVTTTADRLQAEGLSERSPGPDRRTKLLGLTPRGQEVRARLAAEVSRRSTAARLSADERQQLRDLLERLVHDGAAAG